MPYVDGFVVAVPTVNKERYRDLVQMSCEAIRRYGALAVVECWGDDVPEGEITSFPIAVTCRDDETVCFSWIVWPSREERDAGMAALRKDKELEERFNPMPFDGKRMIFGGFEVLAEA